MVTQTSLALASHHAVVADFISDPELALTEVSYNQFSISLGVADAASLWHLYDRLKRPGRRPRITVFEQPEVASPFGEHAFVILKEFHAKPGHTEVEIIASLLLTDKLDLRTARTIKSGLALIDALTASLISRTMDPS